ncbi:aspartate kinase [Desulfopila aestuarii]|uniref:Aspartokinase n=1 Tax=Desulfopila aestuarii DSM 18488 TaxID=1121416 RepID=A0A1M7XWE3_9BACT|nr:aspartate kinase [Desulfopila aestuarii]SHO43065.1 aspartate kinase [Desulfopila aestuarii DSM 18488]
MERIVAKFGGSSVADANQIKKLRSIVDHDLRRRIVVVSAPGKRHGGESKLTDLLYLCQEMGAMATSIDEPFGLIRGRYMEIAVDLNLDQTILSDIDRFGEELTAGCTPDYAASRGEYFSARLIAEYLGAEFIDPAEYIVIRANGTIAPESYDLLGARLANLDSRYVMAGFYGRDRNGEVKTFSRGGSDISGAIAARAAGAACYENWTDTSGILMADPRIIDNPRPIDEISFREIREMAYMGASVFHDEAILPVREASIPIRIKNTNSPEDPGTLITATLSDKTISSTEIAGIAGKKGFSMISLEKSLMNREVGFVYRLLGILSEQGVSFEQCPSSIDSVSVIFEDEKLRGLDDVLIDQICRQLQPDNVAVEKNIALVAVVGEGMVRTVGIAGKIFGALGKAGINVRVINQGASEMNIIIGVSDDDYEATVRVLYEVFVGQGKQS